MKLVSRRLGESFGELKNAMLLFDLDLSRENSRCKIGDASRKLLVIPGQSPTLSSIYLSVAIFGEGTSEW